MQKILYAEYAYSVIKKVSSQNYEKDARTWTKLYISNKVIAISFHALALSATVGTGSRSVIQL